MNYDELAYLVDGITYGSRWRFKVMGESYDRILIGARWTVDDVDGNGLTTVTSTMTLPPLAYCDRHDVMRAVLALIEQLEAHERLELLKVRGRNVWAPHEADGTTNTRPSHYVLDDEMAQQ